MAWVQVLEDTDTTSSTFKMPGGVQFVQVGGHAGGTWVVELENPDGDWVGLFNFDADGEKAFNSFHGDTYRLHGGNAGAKAWASGAYDLT